MAFPKAEKYRFIVICVDNSREKVQIYLTNFDYMHCCCTDVFKVLYLSVSIYLCKINKASVFGLSESGYAQMGWRHLFLFCFFFFYAIHIIMQK